MSTRLELLEISVGLCLDIPWLLSFIPSNSSENFMKALEKDAEERRKKRQVKEERAKGMCMYARCSS